MKPKTNIGIVLSSFHQSAMEKMLGYARDEATKYNFVIDQEIWVPGAMELPLGAQRLLRRLNSNVGVSFRGIVVLGIIEKGETAHGLVMAQSVITALIQLQLKNDRPIGVGVLGPKITPEQIPPRLEPCARQAVAALDSMSRVD